MDHRLLGTEGVTFLLLSVHVSLSLSSYKLLTKDAPRGHLSGGPAPIRRDTPQIGLGRATRKAGERAGRTTEPIRSILCQLDQPAPVRLEAPEARRPCHDHPVCHDPHHKFILGIEIE
jgi:hypothetical protein